MPRLIGRYAAFVRGLAGLAAVLVVAVLAQAACPPEGQSLASLQALNKLHVLNVHVLSFLHRSDRSFVAGRRLELPWFSGTVARLGRQFGIATPIHDTAFRVLSIHAQGRTAPGAAS